MRSLALGQGRSSDLGGEWCRGCCDGVVEVVGDHNGDAVGDGREVMKSSMLDCISRSARGAVGEGSSAVGSNGKRAGFGGCGSGSCYAGVAVGGGGSYGFVPFDGAWFLAWLWRGRGDGGGGGVC